MLNHISRERNPDNVSSKMYSIVHIFLCLIKIFGLIQEQLDLHANCEYVVLVNILEIYKEKVFDLLGDDVTRPLVNHKSGIFTEYIP